MQNRRLALCLLLMFASFPAFSFSLEQGFVYCPAYPCACESDKGALVVNCQYLYLTRLPRFLAFDGRIRTLSLRQNSIRQLPARAFHGLQVESLDLTENVISHVHEDAFEGLEDFLEELHLQMYAMDGIPSAALKRLKKLKVLKIIGCKADTLNSTAFEGMTSLLELSLQGCRIEDIETGGLSSLKQLQVLNLDKNDLQSQHLSEIAKLYDLRKLVLSRNRITQLPDHAFDHLLHLRHMDLSHNEMTNIDVNAFKPLHYSLEVLKLHGNHLTRDVFLPLQNLRNVRHLVLSSNNITSIPVGAFHNHEFLAHLDLSDNGIVEIDKQALKGTEKYLQILRLENNPLSVIHNNTFLDHSRLQQLILDNTKLGGSLSEEVFNGIGKTLRKLSFSGANLTSLDLLAQSKIIALEDLDVSQNFITEIPEGVFHQLHKLIKLDLSRNVIQDLPETAFRGLDNSLESIDLHDNSLQTISSCVFDGFQRLGELRLRGNPLMCDCRLAWLHNWLQMTLPEYHRPLLQWRCAAPQALANRQFASLFMADLQCPSNDTLVFPACKFSNDSSADFYTFEDIPAFREAIPSPLLPLDLMGTFLDVEVLLKGRGTLLAIWNATSTATITGYRVVLRRSNDSIEEADMTFGEDVMRYLFTGLLGNFKYETCVMVLGEEELPMGRDCVESITSNGTVVVDKVIHETHILSISFTTLLWSYISGCIVASILCAIVAVVVRQRQRIRKCVHGFNPGYSAWTGTRYSIPSSTTETSSSYFNTPSVGSSDDDGLVVTINGIDGNHSVVDGTCDTESESDAHGENADAGVGADACVDGSQMGSTCGTLRGAMGGVLAEAGVGEQNNHTSQSCCSTMSSFRRHFPANYIVTSTETGEDLFFHF